MIAVLLLLLLLLLLFLFLFLLLLVEQSVCHIQIGHVQVVHLSERVAHEDIELDRSAMASLHCVQWSVQVVLDKVYLV